MGGRICSTADPAVEVKARISATASAIAMVRTPVLRATEVAMPTRASLLDSLARSRLLFDVHALVGLSTKMVNSLRSEHLRGSRIIPGNSGSQPKSTRDLSDAT
eukprot:5155318-Alexandrium_andersonii.AAC.1